MTEEPTELSSPALPSFADETRRTAFVRLVEHLNSVSFTILDGFPRAEVQSWTIQSAEAAAVIAKGEAASLEDAPFLVKVCQVQFQTADPDELLNHLKAKAVEVNLNAERWADIAAWINGVRARYADQFGLAETTDEVLGILHSALLEIDTFKLELEF